jgi:hypothetical protein
MPVFQRKPKKLNNRLQVDDETKAQKLFRFSLRQSVVLRNVSCSRKVCVLFTSTAVADSATRQKKSLIFNPLFS